MPSIRNLYLLIFISGIIEGVSPCEVGSRVIAYFKPLGSVTMATVLRDMGTMLKVRWDVVPEFCEVAGNDPLVCQIEIPSAMNLSYVNCEDVKSVPTDGGATDPDTPSNPVKERNVEGSNGFSAGTVIGICIFTCFLTLFSVKVFSVLRGLYRSSLDQPIESKERHSGTPETYDADYDKPHRMSRVNSSTGFGSQDLNQMGITSDIEVGSMMGDGSSAAQTREAIYRFKATGASVCNTQAFGCDSKTETNQKFRQRQTLGAFTDRSGEAISRRMNSTAPAGFSTSRNQKFLAKESSNQIERRNTEGYSMVKAAGYSRTSFISQVDGNRASPLSRNPWAG